MHPSSEQDGSTDAPTSDAFSSDAWSSDPFGSSTSPTSSTTFDHHSVIRPMGWHRPRRSAPLPRTPAGWVAWAVGVGVSLLVAGAIYASNGGTDGGAPDVGPVAPGLVRTEAAAACGVATSAVSDPSSWEHGDAESFMGDSEMVFYDVPVDDGSATATVMLENYGDGWQSAGGDCAR
ncbi:hypothetical protein [Solicola sp. PLA-1-18]|uniref:hypothetical protein n=1 Tax=Solicola sp. PLA-1-18 TaxID=3380532 RepID=UPI003B7B15E4